MNRATPKEFELDVGDATKKSVSSKGKMDTSMLTMSSAKKMAGPGETKHGGQQSAALAKLSEVDNSTMRLLKSLDKMNEGKDVSLAQFGLLPLGGSRAVGRFIVPTMLEPWVRHLLDIFPNLTTRSKAQKVVIEDAFLILCVIMRHMEVTTFVEMDEDFFYLCRDAFGDVESINFEVDALCTHLSNLAKAYLGKNKFGTVEGDMDEGLNGRLREQVKHIEEIEKSLAKTREQDSIAVLPCEF
ncbi:hypothetical protein SLEP1_g3774 [Rubroshorea leprosula]|uniref:Uncharacterized protein n=1 Tax=Rubroshorea leprosula TaxID=152421 RepID=A0AAV5HW72_9ROSI|nr:hypothetical protein SLEP1_g3774 [Rubroshorea leprosula]